MSLQPQDYNQGAGVSGGQTQLQPQQSIPVTPAQTTETKEVSKDLEIANQTDMKKSDSLPIVIDFVASQPNLIVSFPNSSSTAKAKNAVSTEAFVVQSEVLQNWAMSLAIQQDEIAQAVLDSWSKSVQVEAEISKEGSLKSDQVSQRVQDSRQSEENVKEVNQRSRQEKEVVAREEDPSVHQLSVFRNEDFMKYWAQAPESERLKISSNFNDLLTEKFNVPANSITVQLDDSQKVIGPYAAALVTSAMISEFVASNYANQVAVQTMEKVLPNFEVNLMVPLGYLTAEATFGTIKNHEGDPAKSKRKIDMEFVNQFANLAKDKVDKMMDNIRDPNKLVQTANIALAYVATTLHLDIKSTSENSNLTKEELQSRLTSGDPDNEAIQALLGYTNEILDLVKAHPEGSTIMAQFDKTMDLLSKIKYASLKDIYQTLFSSESVIGTDERIASEQG